jgi:hypothetical protein
MRDCCAFARTRPCIGALLLLALLAGCVKEKKSSDNPAGNGPANLAFAAIDGSFLLHNGQLLSVAVTPSTGGAAVARDAMVVAGGNFAFAFADLLQPGTDYNIDYYVDVNRDGVCNAPPTDHGWRQAVSGPAATTTSGSGSYSYERQATHDLSAVTTTVNVSHTTAFAAAVCASFPTRTLTFAGTAFPHAGQTLAVNLLRQPDLLKVVSNQTTVVANDGSFGLTFTNKLQQGLSYSVDYYVDLNADGLCDSATDHVWRKTVTAASTDPSLVVTHDATDPAGCSSFTNRTLTFAGTGFPHAGQALYVNVLRQADLVKVVTNRITIVASDGSFSFTFPNSLESGQSYYVDYYVDLNANGLCNSSADHVWRKTVTAGATNLTLAVTHDATDAAGCSSF